VQLKEQLLKRGEERRGEERRGEEYRGKGIEEEFFELSTKCSVYAINYILVLHYGML